MNKLMENPIVKSTLRGLLIAVNAVYAATQTYAAQGNSIGLNLVTALGVAWTLAGVGVAILQRYFDETDPAFGRMIKPVLVEVKKVAKKKTAVKKSGGSGTKPQPML